MHSLVFGGEGVGRPAFVALRAWGGLPRRLRAEFDSGPRFRRRFKLADGSIELFAERVANRGLCAQAQCESIRFKLEGGLAVRRACNGVVRFVMEAGAKGCEVVVGGKMSGARAKVMKFNSGYLKVSGHSKKDYIQTAVRHVMLRSGVIGIKVRIMLGYDPTGMNGPKTMLPDQVIITEPKEDENMARPVTAA